MKQFDITPEKATYVCSLTEEDGLILYQFSYRLAGNIINEEKSGGIDFEWEGAKCGHEIYPYGAPGFPTPHFDLEFFVKMPRILQKE